MVRYAKNMPILSSVATDDCPWFNGGFNYYLDTATIIPTTIYWIAIQL